MPTSTEPTRLAIVLDRIKHFVTLSTATHIAVRGGSSGQEQRSARSQQTVGLTGGDNALVYRMMYARGLDPVAVYRAFGSVVRDMEVTCACCRAANMCLRELDAGTADANCHEFCGVATVIDDLLELQE
jgi:hypothetical protein